MEMLYKYQVRIYWNLLNQEHGSLEITALNGSLKIHEQYNRKRSQLYVLTIFPVKIHMVKLRILDQKGTLCYNLYEKTTNYCH